FHYYPLTNHRYGESPRRFTIALIASLPKMMLEKFRAFTRMLLFCPMFSDSVRIEYLSAFCLMFL
ncbi:MAG: hypothetical protein ACXW1W_18345, partial [Methylococcaceae bacterium]